MDFSSGCRCSGCLRLWDTLNVGQEHWIPVASTRQLGYTISDLMAKKKTGKTDSAAGDPSYAQLHGAARDLSLMQPATSAAEQDTEGDSFGES